ncbi:MAG TPA: Cu(I)-responsive transcriptional regulator [Woeseiaceae bacterium]|nr:Cu(I)-responsive transcriptional regulator [Woeseiaceae bacterium]
MNIGQVAKVTSVPAKRIRYYEQIGLLKPAQRTDAGYRVYGDGDIHSLRFIRRARGLGFSMAQISKLLALWQDQCRSSAEVKAVAASHIKELKIKIGELQSMVDTLANLADQCDGDDRPDCPIIAELQGDKS